jgi:hypothetical protein
VPREFREHRDHKVVLGSQGRLDHKVRLAYKDRQGSLGLKVHKGHQA